MLEKLARLAGFEPATYGLEERMYFYNLLLYSYLQVYIFGVIWIVLYFSCLKSDNKNI